MVNRPWLDEVRWRLMRHALPPSYIQRFVEELSDHLEDLKEENMDTEAAYSRLGKPSQVAEVAAMGYRRHSLLGKHPVVAMLVFGLLPVVSLVALVALEIGGLLVLPDGWGRPLFVGLSQLGSSASVVAAYLVSLMIVVPSIFVAVLYSWLAGRSGIGKKWILLSCMILAVLAALPMCTARIAVTSADSWIRIGLWQPESMWHLHDFFTWTVCRPQQLMQFLVPLAIGCWFMWRTNANDEGALWKQAGIAD